jgi:hypothetical protein
VVLATLFFMSSNFLPSMIYQVDNDAIKVSDMTSPLRTRRCGEGFLASRN